MHQFAVCAQGLEQPRRIAARLASQRVTAVEVGARYLLEHGEAELREVRGAFESEGVTIRSVHGPFRGENDLSHPEEPKRREVIRRFREFLPKVEAIGAEILVVHPGSSCAPETAEHRLALCADSLRELCPHAERHRVGIALENMPPGYPGTGARELLALVESIGAPSLGLTFDTGHAHMAGSVEKMLAEMAPRVVHFHLHDNDGRFDQHVPIPFGTIDWEGFQRVFRTMNFAAPLLLECSPWEDEIPGAGRLMESDFTRLQDDAAAMLRHAEERIAYTEVQQRVDPLFRIPASTPHRNDVM